MAAEKVDPSFVEIEKRVSAIISNQGEVDDDALQEQYQLIVDCNNLFSEIENQIVLTHGLICNNYRSKFPELESIVRNPVDYARVVKKIGNEVDITLVDLQGLLPPTIIMVVCITAPTTTADPLPNDLLQKTMVACERVVALDLVKNRLFDFVETRMECIAPNLSAVVGSAVAAKLLGTAGGLTMLASMPACNVQLLGANKNDDLAGFSSATSHCHIGYIEQTHVFQTTPPALRMRACRLLASKSMLAARLDCTRGDPSGRQGRAYREDIARKIAKWQERAPARQVKPLPVPQFEFKKKRGGRRLRKMKERYAMTDLRKLANRIQFGVPHLAAYE